MKDERKTGATVVVVVVSVVVMVVVCQTPLASTRSELELTWGLLGWVRVAQGEWEYIPPPTT